MNMDKSNSYTTFNKDSSGILSTWPLLFSTAVISTTFSSIVVNMPFLSEMMWKDGIFHAFEMGTIITVKTWLVAFSGILFGIFADKYSRRYLFVFSTFFLGLSYFINGFIPEGRGNITYILLLICQGVAGFALGARYPLLSSFINDHVAVSHRSRFFGIDMALQQFFLVVGMILSTFLFQLNKWREFFWGIGLLVSIGAIFMFFFIKEPKRGSRMEQLESVLRDETAIYDYKINKKTLRKTMLSPTNIIALIEGIFTRAALGMTIFLIVTYLQVEKNVAASSTSVFMTVFALPGAFAGNLALSRLSDYLGKKNVKNRSYLIAFSILGLVGMFSLMFFVPLPVLTADQGKNFLFLMSRREFWVIGALLFFERALQGVYGTNQSPILQIINLPEAQGKITSWNQFLETIGNGLGPLIAGVLLVISSNNFQFTAIVCILIGIPGSILWLLSLLTLTKDVNRIESILEIRAKEITENANKKPI